MPETNDGNKNYYTSTARKVYDFFLGFVGAPVIPAIIAGNARSSFGWMLALGLMIAGVIVSFKVGRHYLAIGMLSILAAPLLVLGACLLAFSR
jgi:hypothetical protein